MNQNIYSSIYNTALLEDRIRVKRFIEDIKNNLSGAPFFLNLFSPKGFGKTAILEQIWEDYEKVLPSSFVRVADFLNKDNGNVALRELLTLIIYELGESLPRRGAPLASEYADGSSKEQLAMTFLSLVSRAKDFEKETLLLMDDYDLIPEDQRRWMQENIFIPASETKKIAFILTSETELRFTENLELRMQLESRELSSLNPDAISRALPQYGEIAGAIYDITGGMPLLTKEFIEQLRVSHVTSAEEFQSHAQELTVHYYREYVENNVLGNYPSNIKDTILILALLRRFDVKVLKAILPDLLTETYKEYGSSDYLDLVDSLRPWVQWRRQGGYALNAAFRKLLHGYVLTIQPNLYKKVNRVIENLYRGLLEAEYREYYLIELLYHVLASNGLEKTSVLSSRQDEAGLAIVENELLQFLKRENGSWLQEVDLDSLRNSLDQDLDLRFYISEKVKGIFQELIDSRSIGSR